ncbi:probable serine/threonine-protein kinase PBL6 [Euphorbia lathyris]|uniref:probable serine/threonine-protein kinase PBL6 n=1 Tax=Euphorbia lathyris TaxID=212925 RepID=UPI003313D963
MSIRKRRDESKQTVIVVLEGTKVSTENTGLAPLCLAMRQVVNPNDEIIVFTLLRSKTSSAGEEDSYVRLLHEEISQRKEVKFQLKIAAGFRPKDIIIEEANNVKATWIVVDRCFARHLPLKLSGTNCDLSLVSDDEEAMSKHCLPANEQPESSSAREVAARSPKSPKLRKGPISASFAFNTSPRSPLMIPTPTIASQECEDQTIPQPAEDHISTNVQTLLRQPLQLTWEVINEMTEGFKSRICDGLKRSYMSYYGYHEDHQALVLVRKYSGDCCSILEAETKAALLLQHKNVHTLVGYHKSEHGIILVFPLQTKGTLDKHLADLSRKHCELAFQDKMKIAIGIARGIRYLHEECIGGPIAHARLQPCNIFLTSDLKPMISGFEHATWLQFRQELPPASRNRYEIENCLEQGSMVLLKADIFSFGVVLLRLFCRKSVPQSDECLIEWARPLLLDRAFHLLLEDETSEDMDMHEMFRVMAAARMCTMSRPILRPSISEVISILKGENFCIIQSSPSISENSAKTYEDADL